MTPSDSKSHIPAKKPVQKTLLAFFKKLETREDKIEAARRSLITQVEERKNRQEFIVEKDQRRRSEVKLRQRRLAAERQHRMRLRKSLMKPQKFRTVQVDFQFFGFYRLD